LVNAILVIKFINVADVATSKVAISAAPALGFAILMIPLLDTLRVFGMRMIHRRSPFSPDRNHVHHLLLDKGVSHRNITFVLVAVNMLFIAGAYFLQGWGCTSLILGIITLFFAGIAALYYTRPKPRLFVAKSVKSKVGSQRMVPLTKDTILEQKN